MAGGWYLGGGICNGTDQGTVLSNPSGTVVTSGAANTKGSWVQLVASSAIDACFITVLTDGSFAFDTAVNPEMAVDIGVGASGSEVVIMANLFCSGYGSSLTNCCDNLWAFPCQIKAGTRIAARVASNQGTGDSATVIVTLYDGEWNAIEGDSGYIDTYGFNTGTTIGTAIDPGSTANTKGSYVQLTASTTYDIQGFALAFDTQAQTTGSTSSIQMLIDVATGGSGSEKVILPNIPVSMCKSTAKLFQISPYNLPYVPIPIVAGTRIAVRAQSSISTATARVFGCTFYGVRL